ncbi:MAG TPA: LysM peptidoglycan-binding domain-containing protein [Thermoclostridium caenicola]|uniref:LysM domain-containing protein n=1 Tax=Thermoclostridium caenicola TaxID=659425 RepID=A0A1M6J7N4_9FIRM|nr:LysM peptidoglycan-binding domain-containing protein [Thermoclostridium caenicola]SHJ42719.1 LysM domain-containing protein [Thermoclostridium caenicola]HOK42882.1 LysM peptidoglycan-binding domain-containing protein [Thermoclostridium caenicola]HOL84494.1 LysM peptidoglycan-binding domain-containing protein [Thermoclostridium caenicola]HOP72269.1 LysM peptidoglycan-binding domain-containing protein [Thermoclostridium caenicola]HPO76397.1 LysM peptidoglycan-binding domain-containing protein
MLKHYRLTNKKRFFAFLVLVFAAFYLAGMIISAGAVSDKPQAPKMIRVQKGDTLWEIAQQHCTGDIRDNIYRIRQINQLSSWIIHEGQILLLP